MTMEKDRLTRMVKQKKFANATESKELLGQVRRIGARITS